MRKFIPLFFLAVSFAYVESAVVVYLRELYYPEGFKFPLKLIPPKMGLIETGREAATLVTIAAIGFVSGKTLCKKISYSIFVFGIWDLFYYIWLKVFLDWPESLLTLDILFLIPLPWVAPVLAPIIVAVSISISSLIAVYLEEKGMAPVIRKKDIAFVIIGALVILVSFIWDFPLVLRGEILEKYHWELLIIGEGIGIWTFINIFKR
ncbi:MAG: hypothetical protein A2Z59_10875 [Nitrospinae bacterium RIFCSPLOWO2_02_39_17]|nr:MAG: hypothetical protein A2Z59_10875 [Nitrospinae bacterium RIFCSPLOWO2_02_39_17]